MTMVPNNTTMTSVRMKVARSASTSVTPTFANTVVSAANNADNSAQMNQFGAVCMRLPSIEVPGRGLQGGQCRQASSFGAHDTRPEAAGDEALGECDRLLAIRETALRTDEQRELCAGGPG